MPAFTATAECTTRPICAHTVCDWPLLVCASHGVKQCTTIVASVPLVRVTILTVVAQNDAAGAVHGVKFRLETWVGEFAKSSKYIQGDFTSTGLFIFNPVNIQSVSQVDVPFGDYNFISWGYLGNAGKPEKVSSSPGLSKFQGGVPIYDSQVSLVCIHAALNC